MSSYTALAKQPPFREENMLVKGAHAKDPADTYNLRAPGLYPDETALKLKDGSLVAVSVETYWLENGEGVGFIGYARWIDEDGTSHVRLDANDIEKQVETAYPVTIDVAIINKMVEDGGATDVADAVDKIASDVARLMLGEKPKLVNQVPAADNSVVETIAVPLLNLNETEAATINIRGQIELARAVTGFPNLAL